MNKVEKMGVDVPHGAYINPRHSSVVPTVPRPPDRPQCRTCPLWERKPSFKVSDVGECHWSGLVQEETHLEADWYCEHHPDYPAWSVWELARRKKEVKE